MKRLRIAVVGSGRLGGFHARKLADRDDVDLVGVVDPDPAARTPCAAACRTAAFADHRQLPDGLDAAVLAAPTAAHAALGAELLERGLHLFVEKPLAATAAEAEALVALARRRRRVLQVGHVERFNPALEAALPCVRNPKYIEAVRAGVVTFRSMDVGAVLDLMIHDLEIVLALVPGPIRRVDALGLSLLGGHEDVAQARLQFVSGCVANFSVSRVSYEAVRRMHLWAPGGFAAVDFAARSVDLVRPSAPLRNGGFDVEALSAEARERCREEFAREHLPRRTLHFDAVDALALELDDFITAIRLGRSPRVAGEQGCSAVALAETILDAIRHHAWDDWRCGLVGPHALPQPHLIPAPTERPFPRRQAG